MELNSFNVGDTVFSKSEPDRPLIVRRYLQRIYYCRLKNDDNDVDLVFFERELVGGKKLDQK